MLVKFYWEPSWRQPSGDRSNPYADRLALALQKQGVHLCPGQYGIDREWLWENRQKFDVLHLNWLHYFYLHENMQASMALARKTIDWLHFAKKLGYKIIWTVHNTYPHEQPFPDIDHIVRIAVSQIADHIVVHCQTAVEVVSETFFRHHQIHVIPHGHFIGVYPNEVQRGNAREKFGFPATAFVYLFFGNARRYKGVERLIESYSRTGDEETRLLLMLRSEFAPAYATELMRLAEGDHRVLIRSSSWFPGDQLQYYLNSADAAVLPFTDVLTSGSAITALSFGVPVVAPAIGCLPELIGEDFGVTYDPKVPDALDVALRKIRSINPSTARSAALAKAQSLNWDEIASKLSDLYHSSKQPK